MNLIGLVITLIVVGVLLWLLNTYGGAFIDGKILKIINAVVVIAVILWLLSVFGVFSMASSVPVPQVR
jgi:hypothetical protein